MVVDFSFEKLKSTAEKLDVNTESSYIKSYQNFLLYFQKLNSITEHNLVIASHFTYGWMPTILSLDQSEMTTTLRLLNLVHNRQELRISDIEFLKLKINNSLVGVSKLLHFIAPDRYVIWDSRIFRYMFKQEPYDYRIGNVNLYLSYLTSIKEISNHKEYYKIHPIVEEKVGYGLTSLRAIEIVIFEGSKI